MTLNGGADGACENWELTKDMLLEEQTPRKAPKRGTMSPDTTKLEASSSRREPFGKIRAKFCLVVSLLGCDQKEKGDTQLSAELREIHSRLLNEGRDVLQPALQQLEELRQEQSHISTLLSTALEETQNLTEMFCTRCPAGWQQFAKTCYYFSTEGKSWIEARAACSMLGAQLAIINSELENKFLANHIMEVRAFWLGLSDMQREGDWEWLDGQSLSISFWRKGEPNNVGQHGEDCATISSSGLWNDAVCTSPEAWICERSC
ncbi:hypothetical protein CIB84_010783 [Bambusicola thoracicus]|uniref:C-type lectin domain-containing protein n=1 Tax=Bambusicola thoracicus TaxID=9083 RepID=A0A2P4SMY7_BAMTH|nr:hypothetical protein CIB84_010783 [Bambusicola thoracicus]